MDSQFIQHLETERKRVVTAYWQKVSREAESCKSLGCSKEYALKYLNTIEPNKPNKFIGVAPPNARQLYAVHYFFSKLEIVKNALNKYYPNK